MLIYNSLVIKSEKGKPIKMVMKCNSHGLIGPIGGAHVSNNDVIKLVLMLKSPFR